MSLGQCSFFWQHVEQISVPSTSSICPLLQHGASVDGAKETIRDYSPTILVQQAEIIVKLQALWQHASKFIS